MNSRLVPPFLGVADNSTFFDQPGGTCPPGSMLNVRPFTVEESRPQIGRRPAIVKAFPNRMGNGSPVQGMGVVSRARAITGYRVGDLVRVSGTGRSMLDGALAGQVWVLRRDFGMTVRRYENVSAGGEFADSGPADQPVTSVVFSKDATKLLLASNYIDSSGFLVARVTCVSAFSGETLWSHKITSAGRPITPASAFVNSMVCSDLYVWVCTNQYVRAIKLSDGTQFGTEFNCNGWSNEAVDAVVSADDRYVFVCFRGSSQLATLASGVTVNAIVKASMWRSGVIKAEIQPAGSTDALLKTPFGPQLESTDRYFEGISPTHPHNYLRFSEALPGCGPGTTLSQRYPRGVWPIAMALMPDGGLAVAHTNSGWGPSTTSSHVYPTKPGNDYAPPGAPYNTLSIFDSSGNWIASNDTASIKELKTDGFYSDIPYTSGEDPSVLALAAGTDGTIYVGGQRQTAVPANCFAFNAFGFPLWSVDLGQTIRENGVAVCGDDGNPVFGGDDSTTWPGASGAHSCLWKLKSDTGEVLEEKYLGTAVACYGVASNVRGDVAFCTEKV